MPGKGMQFWVDDNLASRRVMMGDQRAGVVEQHLVRHATEHAKRTLHAFEPVLLLLPGEGPDMQTPGIEKRCHEEEHLHGRAADLDTPLTEVDLQLLTGARLEPDRCPCLCSKSLAQGGHRTFHSPQADGDTPLSSQFLPNENRPPADQTPVENQPDTLGSCDDSRPG